MKKLQIFQLSTFIILLLTVSCNHKATTNQNEKNQQTNEFILDTTDKQFAGKDFAKKELDRFLNDSTSNLLRGHILIQDRQQLISIAEPILFRIYGKEKILNERPYEIYLFEDCWVMMGTLKKESKGGNFSFAINRITGEVKGICHWK